MEQDMSIWRLSLRLGGGGKKKSIAAAERAQSRSGAKEGEAKEEKKSSTEQKTGPRSVIVSEELLKTIKKEALKTSAITPYAVASKYNLKISTAKTLLRDFASASLLKKAMSNRRTIVYTPIQAKPEEAPAA
jgi:small subunit ribosomal protein S25e